MSVGFALLVVRACGVVYGDIGTSVLYTLREIFFGAHTYGQVPMTRDNILGAVSLIFWALLLLITIKYISFVLWGLLLLVCLLLREVIYSLRGW